MLSACATGVSVPVSVNNTPDTLADLIGNASIGAAIALPDANVLGHSTVIVRSRYTSASGKTCRRLSDANGREIARVLCQSSNGLWHFARDLSVSNNAAGTDLISTAAVNQSTVPGAYLPNDGTVTQTPSIKAVSTLSDGQAIVLQDAPFETTVSGQSLSGPVSLEQPDVHVPGEHVIEPPPQVEELPSIDSYGELVERTVLENENLWRFSKRLTGNALNWQVIAAVNRIDDARTLASGDVIKLPAYLVKDGE